MNLIHLIFASASAQLRRASEPVALIADAQMEHVDAKLKSGKKRSKDFTQRAPASAVALQLESVEDPIDLEYAMAPSYSNRMAVLNYGEPLDRMAVRPYSNRINDAGDHRIYDDGDSFAHAPQNILEDGEFDGLFEGIYGSLDIGQFDCSYWASDASHEECDTTMDEFWRMEENETPFESELRHIVDYVLSHVYPEEYRTQFDFYNDHGRHVDYHAIVNSGRNPEDYQTKFSTRPETVHFQGPVYPWPLPFVELPSPHPQYDAWSKLEGLSRKYNVAMWRIFDGSTTYDYEGSVDITETHTLSNGLVRVIHRGCVTRPVTRLNEKPYTCEDFKAQDKEFLGDLSGVKPVIYYTRPYCNRIY